MPTKKPAKHSHSYLQLFDSDANDGNPSDSRLDTGSSPGLPQRRQVQSHAGELSNTSDYVSMHRQQPIAGPAQKTVTLPANVFGEVWRSPRNNHSPVLPYELLRFYAPAACWALEAYSSEVVHA